MLYISYMHALNIPCKLETSGDWHWGAYKWKNFKLLESQNSIFKDYGIEKNKEIISSECEWVNSDNKFQCEFSVSNKNNILVSGFFFELSQTKNGEMGASEIYVRDTIKI